MEVSRLDDELDADNEEVLSDQIGEVFDTVLKAHVLRLVSAIDKWNDAIEPLIQFSQGLPTSSGQETPSKADFGVRRIGPDASRRYTSIGVFGR